MKSLVCTKPGQFTYASKEKPELTKGHSIIKIKRIGICGTDIHAFEGTQPYFEYPRILGHELSGELINSDAPGFEKGEAVTIIPYFNCGHCVACRLGKTNCCVYMRVCGVHIDGGMVEYLSVPSFSLVHGEGLSFDELALVEPLAIGAHGIRRAGVQPGEFILVAGVGPIGLTAMEFGKLAGARIIAMDVNDHRLQFCKNNLIADHTLNARTENVSDQLFAITNGDMPMVVIDATGSLSAINNAFQYIAHGGRYVLIGIQKGNISFSHPEFHKREATLLSSRNATRPDFDLAINSIKSGKINPVNYITHPVLFDSVKSEFDNWLLPDSGIIKAMVSMD